MPERLLTADNLTSLEGAELLLHEVTRSGLSPHDYARALDRHYLNSGYLYDRCQDFEIICTFGEPLDKRIEIRRNLSLGRAMAHRIVRNQLPTVTNVQLPKDEFVGRNIELGIDDLYGLVGQFVTAAFEEYARHKYSQSLIYEWFSDQEASNFYASMGFGQMMFSARQIWERSPSVNDSVLFAQVTPPDWDEAFKRELGQI
jgi:hypothetical protein